LSRPIIPDGIVEILRDGGGPRHFSSIILIIFRSSLSVVAPVGVLRLLVWSRVLEGRLGGIAGVWILSIRSLTRGLRRGSTRLSGRVVSTIGWWVGVSSSGRTRGRRAIMRSGSLLLVVVLGRVRRWVSPFVVWIGVRVSRR
jgi:hypothetical protein